MAVYSMMFMGMAPIGALLGGAWRIPWVRRARWRSVVWPVLWAQRGSGSTSEDSCGSAAVDFGTGCRRGRAGRDGVSAVGGLMVWHGARLSVRIFRPVGTRSSACRRSQRMDDRAIPLTERCFPSGTYS